MHTTPSLFGTNGIRFRPGIDHGLEFALELGEAIGTFFRSGRVLVGHDGRHSGPSLAKATIGGLLSVGIQVAEGRLVPTPALQYATKRLGYRGAIMITASHNPPEYNGLKVVGGNGMEIPREDETQIEELFARKGYAQADWRGVGTVGHEPDIITTYLEGIQRHVDRNRIKQRRLRVVVDAGNGAQAVAAPYLVEALGCETFSLNAHVDGAFPARGPEPTPDKLTGMAEAVRASGAHFGVAFDGDGDRSIFCDERGQTYWGDRSGALLADFLLSGESGGLVVTTVATSQALDDIVERRGGRVLRTRVGSVDVSQAMMEHSALFGVEENGGCFYGPHLPVRDGAMTTALMTELLASRNEPLSQLLETVPTYFQSKAKVPCPDAAKSAVMDRVLGEATGRVDRTDGAKIWQDERSWVLIRPSGTEPIIRLFAESDSERILKQMVDRYADVLQQALNRVTS